MEQRDLVINNISIVVNTNEEGVWTEDSIIFLHKDITEKEVKDIMQYLYDEGFIVDRRTKYQII